MHESLPKSNQDSSELVRNKRIAETLAHAQEDMNRVDDYRGKALGLPEGSTDAEKADILNALEQQLIRNGGSMPNEEAGAKNELGQQRYAIRTELKGRIAQNLGQEGFAVDVSGNVVVNDGLSAEAAQLSNTAISGVDQMIDRALRSSQDGKPNSVKLPFERTKNTTQTEAEALTLAERATFAAVGLEADAVMNAPYELTMTAENGWSLHTKLIPTEIPGVMYKATYQMPPEGSDKDPIMQSAFEMAGDR